MKEKKQSTVPQCGLCAAFLKLQHLEDRGRRTALSLKPLDTQEGPGHGQQNKMLYQKTTLKKNNRKQEEYYSKVRNNQI